MRKLAPLLALLLTANSVAAQESVTLTRESRMHEITAVLDSSGDSFNKLIVSKRGKEMIALCGLWGRGVPSDCVTEEGKTVFLAVIGRAVCGAYRKELQQSVFGQPWKTLSDEDAKVNIEFVKECQLQSKEAERISVKK